MLAPAAMSRNASQAHAYRRVGVETGVDAATPHQLVTMLFDGFGDAIAQARSALQRRDIEAKCKAISRAARIVDEGLKASLDVRAGGKLGEDLNAHVPFWVGAVAVALAAALLASGRRVLAHIDAEPGHAASSVHDAAEAQAVTVGDA